MCNKLRGKDFPTSDKGVSTFNPIRTLNETGYLTLLSLHTEVSSPKFPETSEVRVQELWVDGTHLRHDRTTSPVSPLRSTRVPVGSTVWVLVPTDPGRSVVDWTVDSRRLSNVYISAGLTVVYFFSTRQSRLGSGLITGGFNARLFITSKIWWGKVPTK